METRINLKSFSPNNHMGIIFSVYENLSAGESFKIISDAEVSTLKREFDKVLTQDYKWQEKQLPDGVWEVKIEKPKASSHSSCCGGCSG